MKINHVTTDDQEILRLISKIKNNNEAILNLLREHPSKRKKRASKSFHSKVGKSSDQEIGGPKIENKRRTEPRGGDISVDTEALKAPSNKSRRVDSYMAIALGLVEMPPWMRK